MELENESADAQKIRNLMKRLEKEKAPWYFDARLKQQLTDESVLRRPLILRPAFGLPLAAALTAVVLYLSLPDSNETLPGFPGPEEPASSLPDPDEKRSQDWMPAEQVPSEPEDYLPVDGSSQRGPSGGSSDPFVPSTIIVPQTDPANGPASNLLTAPVPATSLQLTLEADTLDSLDKKADSLQHDRR